MTRAQARPRAASRAAESGPGGERIVFVAYGSFGDIYPLLAVARTLRDQGHRVLFVANAYFADAVGRAGVEYAPAGTCEEQLAARETAGSSGDTFEGAMTRYDFLIGRNYARVGALLERLVHAGERLLVVTHGRLSPVFPACEQHGLPVVLTYLAPGQIPDNREDYVLYHASFGTREWVARHLRYPLHRLKTRVYQTPLRSYNAWRKQSGYPRVPGPLMASLRDGLRGRGFRLHSRHPSIVSELALFPEWFGDPIGDDLRHVVHCGFVFHADESPENDRRVDAFVAEHGAPVVFTPGTAVEDAEAFCRVVPETCRRLEAPAIVLSRYVAARPERFGLAASMPPVLALDHVDLGTLLPKARLLVHHGGIGTLAQAVRAGIPQIVRPRMYDQPSNGLRAVLNGVGGMLYDDGYTAEGIAAVYRQLVTSEVHREHLAHYGALTRSEDGAGRASDAIAGCLEGGRARVSEPGPASAVAELS